VRFHAKLESLPPLKSIAILLRFALLLALVPLSASAGEFLWLSDIHFDPLADPLIVDRLAVAEPAQWRAILTNGSTKFPAFGHDATWPLFSSLLQASGKALPKPAFTMVTGDLLAHHFRERFNAEAAAHDDNSFRSFVRKSVEFVALELKEVSAGAPVLIALGNNDSECGDYSIQPGGPFLHDTAKLVTDLSGAPDSDSYERYGSYSVSNPAVKHERIIVLNTVLFSPRYRDLCGHGTDDPGARELAWLAGKLQEAESHHEKVWLVYHIPPGVDAYVTARAQQRSGAGSVTLLWKESYTDKFLSLLTQYAQVVGPNFAGHIHVDDFRLLGGSTKSSPFVIAGPAASPITGQNPTFRLVQFDARGKLEDESTYYLKNLTAAGVGAAPVWTLEYDFRTAWKLSGLNAESFAKLYGRIASSPEAAARWTLLYSTSNLAGSPVTAANSRQFYCAMGNLSQGPYETCVAAGNEIIGRQAIRLF
jgi:sphingomyelin phosphodiesterase acid-like 3